MSVDDIPWDFSGLLLTINIIKGLNPLSIIIPSLIISILPVIGNFGINEDILSYLLPTIGIMFGFTLNAVLLLWNDIEDESSKKIYQIAVHSLSIGFILILVGLFALIIEHLIIHILLYYLISHYLFVVATLLRYFSAEGGVQ